MSRAIDHFVRTRRLVALGLVIFFCTPCLGAGLALSSVAGAVVMSILPAVAIALLVIEPYTNLGLRRQLREARGAMCPGCAYPLADIQAEVCPECGERWTVESAQQAWRRALGPGWANVLAGPSDE